uniref:C-type lectin domain-containing protein n=1 Tax=Gopherus agassizii TaxID=38772 RepID=A0A452HST4_9SAUR
MILSEHWNSLSSFEGQKHSDAVHCTEIYIPNFLKYNWLSSNFHSTSPFSFTCNVQFLNACIFKGNKSTHYPEKWMQHRQDCYHFSNSWKPCKALCSSLDSRFLKIESKEELGFIIRSAQSYSSYSLWIALSRKGADGSWLWEDGRAFSTDLISAAPWVPGGGHWCQWVTNFRPDCKVPKSICEAITPCSPAAHWGNHFLQITCQGLAVCSGARGMA